MHSRHSLAESVQLWVFGVSKAHLHSEKAELMEKIKAHTGSHGSISDFIWLCRFMWETWRIVCLNVDQIWLNLVSGLLIHQDPSNCAIWVTARAATASQELGKTLLQQKEKPRREELSHYAQSRSYQSIQSQKIINNREHFSSVRGPLSFLVRFHEESRASVVFNFEVVLLWMGFGILCRTGLWQWSPSGPINLLLTVLGFRVDRALSSCSIRFFSIPTQVLSRFLCLAVTCTLLFWAKVSEQHERRKRCEVVDGVTRYIMIHSSSFFHVLSCSFMFFLQVRFGYKQSWAVSEFWLEDVSWYSCPHWYCAGRCSRCREAPVLQVVWGLFWNMDTTQGAN